MGSLVRTTPSVDSRGKSGLDALSWVLAAMGATFAFTESFVANQRQKDDALNGVAGGCAAGFLAGVKCTPLLSLHEALANRRNTPQRGRFPWPLRLVLSWVLQWARSIMVERR